MTNNVAVSEQSTAVRDREGIYFGLPEADYHADRAIGSSGMKELRVSPEEWWFGSPYNPAKLEKPDTAAQILGSAYHALLLEGREALGARYAPKMESWATKAGKDEKAAMEAAGLHPIPADDWSRLLVSDMVVQANKTIRNAFRNGPTEVSIFWREGMMRKKARIDCLKLNANVDAKTIAPKSQSQPMRTACLKAMAEYNYPVQIVHYNDARAMIPAFVNEGMVYGDHDAALLAKIAAVTDWSSVFVFLKKTGAPLTWATKISRKNPVLEVARVMCDRATANYVEFIERFGLDAPWLDPQELEELEAEAMPAWWGRE